jgi:tetratricopeptide (TPR) repeat protein
LAAFERARDRDPWDSWTWCGIGDSLIALGRDQEGYRAFRQALLRDPAHVRSNENGAELARRIDRTGLAWVLNDVARELAPENPFNHLVHGRLLVQQGDWSGAIGAYDRVLALDPDATMAVVRRANALVQLGREREARQFLERYDESHPGLAEVKVEIAGLAYDEGQLERAATICREAIAIAEDSPGAHGILAASLAAMGDVDAGLVSMERALLLHPSYAWLFSEMGRHLLREGRATEAVQSFAAAMAWPAPRRQCDLGVALAQAGFPDKARPHLESAARSGRLGEDDLVRVATCMHGARQEPHALFDELTKQRPDDLALLCARARLQLEVYWRPDIGERLVEEIHSRAADHAYAHVERARELMHDTLEAEQEAETLLRELITTHPRLSYPKHLLATLLLAQDRPVEVLTLLAGTDLHFSLVKPRFLAYLRVGSFDAAEALLQVYQDGTCPQEGVTAVGTLILWYYWALYRGDWHRAAKLCPEIDRVERSFGMPPCEAGLTEWSIGAFRCLLLLGDAGALSAWRVANTDKVDPGTFGFIACHAHDLGNLDVAADFAKVALDRDPEEPDALQVTARIAEVEGDVSRALALWAKGADVMPEGHIWSAQRARVALGTGDLRTALREADAAVKASDKNTLSRSLRAQARLLAGDLHGAADDFAIAWARTEPEWRELPFDDLAALGALFQGDRLRADELFKAHLANAVVSSLDRARIGRLMEHVPRIPLIPPLQPPEDVPRFVSPEEVQKRRPGAIRGLVPGPVLRSRRPQEPLTPAQRWVVALHGTLTHMNDGSYAHLGMWPRNQYGREYAAGRLGRWWTIRSRSEAIEELRWLESAGHSADYEVLARAAASPDIATLEPRIREDKETSAQLDFVRERRAELGERRLLAWDYGRLAAVAGWSCLAGYIDEAEAWEWSFRAARVVQSTYGSWEEFGRHYLLGRVFGMGEEGGARQACEWLLSSEQSPWRQLAWLTNLDAAAPSPAAQRCGGGS